jgi:hypothetical protein
MDVRWVHMGKISSGLIILIGCLILTGVTSAASSGTTGVSATLSSGIGIDVSDIGPWALQQGANTWPNNYVTVYQLGGTASVTWSVKASASNVGGYLTSASVPLDKLGSQLKLNGAYITNGNQVATGSTGPGSSTQVNLPLSQEVTNTDNPHNDYQLTITYTLTP